MSTLKKDDRHHRSETSESTVIRFSDGNMAEPDGS